MRGWETFRRLTQGRSLATPPKRLPPTPAEATRIVFALRHPERSPKGAVEGRTALRALPHPKPARAAGAVESRANDDTLREHSEAPGGHPAPQGTTIYHWHGGLLLAARTLVLDRPTRPIAATLRIALNEPYTIEVEGRVLTTRASLVGSKRERTRIAAIDSDLILLYVPLEWPAHRGLQRMLGAEAVIELGFARFEPIVDRLRAALHGDLPGRETKEIAAEMLGLIAPRVVAPKLDERIVAACELLATTPLNQFSLPELAARVDLSASRLRRLFKQEIGQTISEYARWSAIWQVVGRLKDRESLTEIALEAGFFDLAHADRTMVEVFGMIPSLASDPRFVRLVSCD